MDERIWFGLYQSCGNRVSAGRLSVFWLLLFATTRSIFKSVKVSVVEIAKRTNSSHRIPP